MHINMKYYIVTIGAIFISLGIGILVGFNLNYDQELSKQQAQIIGDLDVKFEELRKKNNDLETKLKEINTSYDKTIDYINNNSDKLISEELTDKSIGIISINGNSNSEYIENAITKADGNVVFNINLKTDTISEEILNDVSTNVGVEIKNESDLINYVVESLKNDNARENLKYLEQVGLLDLNKLESNHTSYTSVVLSEETNTKDLAKHFESIDKLLVEKLKSEGKYLVGVENTNKKISYIELYSENKIATIDNINQGSGNLALVLALKDENVVGNFGISETAESLIPYK
ncbi:hypothetical protein EAI30_01390 [Romboutsia ilealis]|uniref:Copper transporter n=1 Tax=Romboutsia faecis TaxID=2764597 RepID=A0ABR7JMB6_9FIRM|nr:copper transporter [Romboutsia faecis]MBC5996063.1 copper transporter [Romboutsia faecis]MRN23263.1 hypothetical protein [Romboutsia ilealis]